VLSRFAGASEANAEREFAGEILSESKDLCREPFSQRPFGFPSKPGFGLLGVDRSKINVVCVDFGPGSGDATISASCLILPP
jgi:hypothetical protein